MISILSFDTALNHVGVCYAEYNTNKSRMIGLSAYQENTLDKKSAWYKERKRDDTELLCEKAKTIFDLVDKCIGRTRPNFISIEIPMTRYSVSQQLVTMACGAMLSAIGNYNIQCRIFKPQEWKKSVIGNGKADKKLVYDIVSKICSGHNVNIPEPIITKAGNITNSDVYDAIAINLALYYQIRQGVDHV